MTSAVALCLASLLAAGAGGGADSAASQPAQPAATMPASASAGPELRVLCTTFPIYLFVRNVAAGRDNIHLSLLLSAGMGCPHDYVVTPQDMQTIASADVVIINGLGMEEFLGPALTRANPRAIVIDSSAGIHDVLYMEGEHEHLRAAAQPAAHATSADAHEADKEHHRRVPNPHLFASPAMAAKLVANIAEGLARLDPSGAECYRTSAKAYAAKLTRLAREFTETVANLTNRKIVTEHAVFDYLGRDCGLEIVAVIQQAPGQEPAAAEMLELVRLIRSSGAGAIFTEPQYPSAAAETIAREAGVKLGVLDPVAAGPADAARDYYEKVMSANIRALEAALGQND